MLLVPGARASLQLQWFNWCGTASPGTIAFHLSLPTGTLVAPAEWPAPGGGTPNPEAEVPRCDDPQAPSTLSVGGFQLVPANTATPAPDLLANVRVVLAAPATAAPGEAIAYRVALTDTRSDPVPLTPCPTYLEALVPAIGLPIAKELHALNCAPVGTLDPGRPVTFAMVLQVPAGAPAGSASLSWEFVGPGLPAPPRAALTITSP